MQRAQQRVAVGPRDEHRGDVALAALLVCAHCHQLVLCVDHHHAHRPRPLRRQRLVNKHAAAGRARGVQAAAAEGLSARRIGSICMCAARVHVGMLVKEGRHAGAAAAGQDNGRRGRRAARPARSPAALHHGDSARQLRRVAQLGAGVKGV